jgi:hypothetical protein
MGSEPSATFSAISMMLRRDFSPTPPAIRIYHCIMHLKISFIERLSLNTSVVDPDSWNPDQDSDMVPGF